MFIDMGTQDILSAAYFLGFLHCSQWAHMDEEHVRGERETGKFRENVKANVAEIMRSDSRDSLAAREEAYLQGFNHCVWWAPLSTTHVSFYKETTQFKHDLQTTIVRGITGYPPHLLEEKTHESD